MFLKLPSHLFHYDIARSANLYSAVCPSLNMLVHSVLYLQWEQKLFDSSFQVSWGKLCPLAGMLHINTQKKKFLLHLEMFPKARVYTHTHRMPLRSGVHVQEGGIPQWKRKSTVGKLRERKRERGGVGGWVWVWSDSMENTAWSRCTL